MNDQVIIPLCSHVRTNGQTCGSPALRGNTLCHFHNKIRITHRRPQSPIPLTSDSQEYCIIDDSGGSEYQDDPDAIARAYPHQNEIEFPPLEDAESIQLATSMLFQAIATGQIHFKRARLLVSTVKVASTNQRFVLQSRTADAAAKAAAPPRHVILSEGRVAAEVEGPASAGCPVLTSLGRETEPLPHPVAELPGPSDPPAPPATVPELRVTQPTAQPESAEQTPREAHLGGSSGPEPAVTPCQAHLGGSSGLQPAVTPANSTGVLTPGPCGSATELAPNPSIIYSLPITPANPIAYA